jgi:hypothetical protein
MEEHDQQMSIQRRREPNTSVGKGILATDRALSRSTRVCLGNEGRAVLAAKPSTGEVQYRSRTALRSRYSRVGGGLKKASVARGKLWFLASNSIAGGSLGPSKHTRVTSGWSNCKMHIGAGLANAVTV